MTYPQAKSVLRLLLKYDPDWVHHGDCLGADLEFHFMASGGGFIAIHVHPPTDDKNRAFCEGDKEDEPLDYLERNRVIVSKSEILIAAPAPSSRGTWATVNYARKKEIPIHVVSLNGSVENVGA